MTEHISPNSAQVPPQLAMLQMISGFWISRAIYVVAKLGLADHMQEGPKTAEELAAATHTHAPSLFRVLRALSSVGVLVQSDDNRSRLREPTHYLCKLGQAHEAEIVLQVNDLRRRPLASDRRGSVPQRPRPLRRARDRRRARTQARLPRELSASALGAR